MADGFQISVRDFKAGFFDSRAIEARVDAWRDNELSKMAARTRLRMKQSLRYRKKASKPGEPPSVHRDEGFKRTTVNRKTGVATARPTSPLKELIFYSKDRATGSFVVGPAKFGNRPGVVPPTIEKGGPAVIVEAVPKPKGRKATARQSENFRRLIKDGRIVIPPREKRLKTIRVAPRPFVQRAGEAEARSGLRKASR